MNCKVCNTRLSPGDSTCLNCGTEAPRDSAFSRQSQLSRLPSAELSMARSLDAAVDEALEEHEQDVELELDDVSGEIDGPSVGAGEPAPAATALVASGPAGLRRLLAEQPEAIEPGLSVYRNDDGAPVGAGYASGVGDIDLLARNADGDLVVVMISGDREGEALVAEVLRRVGWVRKHLGDDETRVRGIVVCEAAPEGLAYSAAAVADTVRFKSYRVALVFEDLEI